MRLIPNTIPGVLTLLPDRHQDSRGFFEETFRSEWLPDHTFVQDNHSYSKIEPTLRGLHFQVPPFQQAKLIRVGSGRIRDVAVDLRVGSPTYLKHLMIELSAGGGEQLFVPEGFAHGFATLEPDTVVLYKVTNYHSFAHERGIAWNDPTIRVKWGLESEPLLSDRDRGYSNLDPTDLPFAFVPRQ